MSRSKEGDLRRSQTAIKIIMLELGFGLLYGCSASAAASEIDLPPPTQPKPEETTPVPPNWIAPTTVFDAAENPFRTLTSTQTLTLTSTPPTEVGFDPTCFPETVRTEIEANFPANETLVTLSEGKFREAIGLENPETVLLDATNRISAIAGYYAKYPDFGINRIVVPADIEPADIKNAIAEIKPAAGSNLTVVEYVTGMDLSPGTALMAIHVGVAGGNWEVFAWTNGPSAGTRLRVDEQRSDGTWRVGGLIHIWTITQDGRLVLAEVPEQLEDGRPDVAIVDGCNPTIVRVDNDDQVTGIFKEGIPFITAGNEVDKGAEVWWTEAEAEATAEPPPGLEKLTPPGGTARYEAGEKVESREEASLFSENDIARIANEAMNLLARFAGSEPVKIGLPEFLEGKIYQSKIEDAERMGIEVFFKKYLRGEIYSQNGAWNIEIAAFDGGESAIMIRNPEGKLMLAAKEGELTEIPFQKFFENEKILAVNVDGNIRYALADKNGQEILAFINESWDAENPQTAFEWLAEDFRAELDRNLNFSFSGVMEKSAVLNMIAVTGYPLNFPEIKETPKHEDIVARAWGRVASYQLESKNGNSELKVGVIVEGKFLVVKPDMIVYVEVIEGVPTAVFFDMNGFDFETAKTAASILDYALGVGIESDDIRNYVQFLLNQNGELTEAEIVDFVRSLLIPVPDDLLELEVGYDEKYVESNFEIWLRMPLPQN